MQERTIRLDHAELTGAPAIRYDAGKLGKLERTPIGGVRIPASLGRTGVLLYQNPDGTTRREYRPESEVFHQDALRSYEDAAVTIGHPATGKVTTETARADKIGHVRAGIRRDGEVVAGEVAIDDAPAIARIDAGETVEISSGYDILYDPTPGTAPNGERYDGVQRRIRANHVALLPRGGGRSGREVALRIDASAAMEIEGNPAPRVPAVETRIDSMKTQRIDGIDYEVGSAAWAQAIAQRDQRTDARLAELEKRVKDAETAVTTQTARADTAEKRVKELEAELAPERLDARVTARTSLLERVRPVLGETKLDGKGEVEIMTLALAKLDPEIKLNAIPAAQREIYVRARFDAEIKNASRRSPLDDARSDALPLPPTRTDEVLPLYPGSGFGGSVVDEMKRIEAQQRKS